MQIASTASIDELLMVALKESDARARATLAEAPWANPDSRNVSLIAGEWHQRRMRLFRDREALARAARADADAARSRLTFTDRLLGSIGKRTAAVHNVDLAEAAAIAAEIGRDGGDKFRMELRRLDRDSAAPVRRREAERSAWFDRLEVRRAQQELHGNELVRQAVTTAPRLVAWAAQDLSKVCTELLRRENTIKVRDDDRDSVSPSLRLPKFGPGV